MQFETFVSLYGFSLCYPANWMQSFDLGRALFSSPKRSGVLYPLTINTVQTNSPSTTALADQIRRTCLKIDGAELFDEQTIQLCGLDGYSCSIRYADSAPAPDDSSQSVSKQALVLALPLHSGKATTLMTFNSELETFATFNQEYVQPMLTSFQLEKEYRLPAEGYRRLARDEYGIAIDFPKNWLISGLDQQNVAFRSPKQRWQIDNISLVTSRREGAHTLRDFCALARSSFQSDADAEVIGEHKSTLGGLPSYSIEYTIVDRLQVLNQGRQTLTVTSNGTLVNLTTLAPKDKLDEYTPTFQAVHENFIIKSDALP